MDELPENSKGGDHGVNAYVDSLLSTVQPDAMSLLDAEILNGVDNFATLSDVGIEERVDGFDSSIGYSPTSGSFEYIENSNALFPLRNRKRTQRYTYLLYVSTAYCLYRYMYIYIYLYAIKRHQAHDNTAVGFDMRHH